jgi:two-component system NtrC family sensor kinase
MLIVEDSPTQAFQLSLLLQEAGFDVVTAGDAEAGHARLTQQPFDAVLSDLLLPGASGFELCRRIKADPQLRPTPVIILTSECDPLNVLRGLEAGADDFMTKDHASAEIVGRLRRTLTAQMGVSTAPPEKAAQAASPARSVVFLGAPFQIAAGRDQLLNVLLSAFDDVVYLNRRYEESLEALRRLSEQLRHSVQAEQQALARFKDAESRLVQAEKLSSLGKMVAGLAHEINNPLAFTSTNVTVLKRDTGALHELIALYRQADELLARQRPELMTRILTLAGLGVAPAIRDKVFDPFFTTKPPGKGIGLGLSISYAIVHDHRGSITFDTAVGKRTTFTIAIPRDRTASIAT